MSNLKVRNPASYGDLAAAAEQTTSGLMVLDPRGISQRCNKAAQRIFEPLDTQGLSFAELVENAAKHGLIAAGEARRMTDEFLIRRALVVVDTARFAAPPRELIA